MTIELEDIKLFDGLTEISINNSNIDLHNDYDCIGFYLDYNKDMILKFVSNDNNQERNTVNIIFKETEIVKLTFPITGNEEFTLDNFYRGRYQNGNTLLDETKDGKKCFYIDFYEEQAFEVLAEKVIIELGKQ